MGDRRITRSRTIVSTTVATASKNAGTEDGVGVRNVNLKTSKVASPKSKEPSRIVRGRMIVTKKMGTVTDEETANKLPSPTPLAAAAEKSVEGQGTSTGAQKKQGQTKRKNNVEPDESKEKRVVADLPESLPITTASPGIEDSEVGDVEDIGMKPKWSPNEWRKALRYIRMMRAERTAPVDTMGCERTMEENVEPKVRRYQALVSLMLSSQTKDQVTFAAMERLKTHGLTVQSMLDLDELTLGQILTPVGFWKKKASYIKRATEILRAKYDDDIPETIEGLCALPGVGPKMGYIALSVAWGKNAGIGVDTHVHRIANRLGWAGEKGTKTPEQTRLVLESWLPNSIWQEVNILLVGFGQEQCLPVNPKCATCLANEYCPFGIKELNLGFLLSKKAKRTVD